MNDSQSLRGHTCSLGTSEIHLHSADEGSDLRKRADGVVRSARSTVPRSQITTAVTINTREQATQLLQVTHHLTNWNRSSPTSAVQITSTGAAADLPVVVPAAAPGPGPARVLIKRRLASIPQSQLCTTAHTGGPAWGDFDKNTSEELEHPRFDCLYTPLSRVLEHKNQKRNETAPRRCCTPQTTAYLLPSKIPQESRSGWAGKAHRSGFAQVARQRR